MTVSDAPGWTTSAGSLGTIDGNFSGTVATVAASGDTVTFSETTNVLTNASQANCTLNSSTGVITTTDFGGSSTVANSLHIYVKSYRCSRPNSRPSVYTTIIIWINRRRTINIMAYTNLTRTPSSNGNRQKFTISTWIKRPEPAGQGWILTVDSYPSGNMFQYQLDTGSYLGVQQYHGSSAQAFLTTHDVLTDPGAWYHIVLRVDTTQSTAADRIRFYINGTEPNYNVNNLPSLKILSFKLIMLQNNLTSREDTSTGSSVYYIITICVMDSSYAPTEFWRNRCNNW